MIAIIVILCIVAVIYETYYLVSQYVVFTKLLKYIQQKWDLINFKRITDDDATVSVWFGVSAIMIIILHVILAGLGVSNCWKGIDLFF